MKKMCKRSLALLMTMVMVCGAIMVGGDGLLSFKASAIGTYGVNLDSAAYNGWNPFAVSGYSGQCTWYAWGRAREKLGIDVPCRGDAVDWPNQAGSYLVNSTPSSNAICVWTHYNPGHVAYVESYDAGLNRIYITEANANNTRYSEGYIDLNTGNYTGTYGWVGTWSGRGNPHQYIHLQATHTCNYSASVTITKAPTRTETGTRVYTCSCGKTTSETIPAIPYTTGLTEGIYTITSKIKSNLRITCTSDRNLCVWNNPGEDSDWLFRKNSDGTYTIENAYHDGLVIDVWNLDMFGTGNIGCCPYNGGDNQRFYVIPEGNYYRFVAKHSYMTIDLLNAATSDGSNILQLRDNGSDAQRWSIDLHNPPISLSATSVTVSKGGSKTINCTIGREIYGTAFKYSCGTNGICSVNWGSWNGLTLPMTITGVLGGTTTVTVTLFDYDTKINLTSKTITVTVPDTDKPSASITSTNNVATSQTVTLSIIDSAGLAGYYWGTSSSYSSNTYTSVSGTSKSVERTVSSAGTYYLTAKDTSGNVSSTVSKTFYTTTLNANGGSVSPTSVLTMSGNSFTPPTPTRSGYTFKNWNTKSDGTGTSYPAGGTYKANAAATLYAQWTKNASVTSIAVKTLPTKTVYDVGESFRSAGLTLTATYSDGSTQSVTSGFACTGFTSDMAGTKTVTVTYGGQSTTFTVTVVGTTVTIADFRSERTEHYKTSVRFYAVTEKAPANTTVHWFVNGADVGTGNEYTVRQPKEDYTVQAKLLDSNGQTVAESETETVHVRHDLWSRLRALIQWLFGVDYVVDQRENDLLASVQDA